MAEADRVIVAGAGPVGMTAASYLAMHDIPVLVLEAGDDLATDLRASTWHPPTLDMLDFFDGLTGEIADWGLVAPAWQYRDRETGPVVDLGHGPAQGRHRPSLPAPDRTVEADPPAAPAHGGCAAFRPSLRP